MILGTLVHPAADVPLDFATPTPIADAIAGKADTDETISGTPQRGRPAGSFTDASGSIALSRSMGLRAAGEWIVRGHVAKVQATTQFVVTEFAPAFDNLNAEPVPTPIPLPSGMTPVPRHTLRPMNAHPQRATVRARGRVERTMGLRIAIVGAGGLGSYFGARPRTAATALPSSRAARNSRRCAATAFTSRASWETSSRAGRSATIRRRSAGSTSRSSR